MDDFLVLKRADKKGNDTMPEKYHTDGLLTKQLGSNDDPNPHEKYGWLKTIISHIAPDDELQKFIYSTSAFLSFTTEQSIADKYLATRKKLKFIETEKKLAEAYLITARIPKSELKKIGIGLYLYEYSCNYDKVRTNYKYFSFLSDVIGCNICKVNNDYKHRLLVIDAETYLQQIKDEFTKAYSNAINDKEYLLLPLDPMVNGPFKIGFQSRIPLADFWDIDFFRY